MSRLQTLRDHVRDHRRGMAADLVFAVVWVSVASLLADLLGAPEWAAYLLMGSGVLAYFGFVWSLSTARSGTARRE